MNVSIPAPVLGLVESSPVAAADPRGAEVLRNFLPTQRGIKVRAGHSRAAFVTDPVITLHTFNQPSGSGMFAATADAIYDITAQNPTTAPAPSVSLMTSGDWSSQQIGVAGGDYLVMVNGADLAQIYDGTSWNPLTDEAVNELDYDGLTADFAIGETVTGGTSGASAEVLGVVQTSGTTGTLKLGAITSGPFQDDEAITSAGGAAVANGANSAASAINITGQATDTFSHVWLYKSRLFFVEKDTLTAHYLPTAQVGGAASDLSLAGVFRRGGSLLFGATWSLDSGDGMDDMCVFVSTEGEVAIYAGSDPSDATDWALQGRYDIGKPLGKRGTMQAGGDLAIATDDGIVPLSEAIRKDPAALSLSAVTRPIQDSWRARADGATSVELHKWSDENLMLTVFPAESDMLTANLQTGAWAVQTGWHCTCGTEYNGDFFVGRSDGRVYKINDTGLDDDATFTAQVCFAFSDMGAPTSYKMPSMARAAWFATGEWSYKLEISADYKPQFSAVPAVTDPNPDAALWGTAVWGTDAWGGDNTAPRDGVQDLWRSVSKPGFALAPTVQISSGSATALNVELVRIDMIVEAGGRAA